MKHDHAELLTLCFVFVSVVCADALAVPIAGDVDLDGSVDATDVQLVINAALGLSVQTHTDINYSNGADAVDVQLVINAALRVNIDLDNDGLCDEAEANLGTDPEFSDSDGDCISDGQEVMDSTDPLTKDVQEYVCADTVIDGPGPSLVEFTFVPERGQFANLRGRVGHVAPCDFRVAVYIYVEVVVEKDESGLFGKRIMGGWWNKPTWAEPLTNICGDGTWVADITTGGVDETATKIAAFLIPDGCELPLLDGDEDLPQELFDCAVAHAAVQRTDAGPVRLLYFYGHEWWVKASTVPVGPGPNYFSDSTDNVWVDAGGQLHMKITESDGIYICAEVVSSESFGYGTYAFSLADRVDDLDPNVVLGLFTWSDDPAYHYREIDIEFSRWGDESNDNAQFVVQPWDTPGNMERFNVGPNDVPSIHSFIWLTESIAFTSVHGTNLPPSDPAETIHMWEYVGSDIPMPGDENARMNLWLMWGNPPLYGEGAEVVISAFTFEPE